jgi:DNA-binding NarL/FixJ family response regulator
MGTSVSAVSSLVTQQTDAQLMQAATTTTAAAAAAPTNEDTVTLSSNGTQSVQDLYSQVLQLSDQGQTNQQIATALQISLQTVNGYLQPIISAPSTTNTTA